MLSADIDRVQNVSDCSNRVVLVVTPLMYIQMYLEQYQSPPVVRNMPPISGKICWARQLFHHLDESMTILQHYQEVIQSFSDGNTLIRKYNRIGILLTDYEMTHHKAWWDKIVQLSSESMQVLYIHVISPCERRSLTFLILRSGASSMQTRRCHES